MSRVAAGKILSHNKDYRRGTYLDRAACEPETVSTPGGEGQKMAGRECKLVELGEVGDGCVRTGKYGEAAHPGWVLGHPARATWWVKDGNAFYTARSGNYAELLVKWGEKEIADLYVLVYQGRLSRFATRPRHEYGAV